jgi:SAM-dependent methyltransferase
MGIDTWSLDFLLKFRKRNLGRTLMLGRQGFHINDDDEIAVKVLNNYDTTVSMSEIRGTTGYAEAFLYYLGSTQVLAMDVSKYENADLIFDLNNSIPDSLKGQFDTILDCGTIEHIYNFPVAIKNVKKMLKVGGLALIVTNANNWLGHGFYQFSPELMWRVFSRHEGFEVEIMQTVEIGDFPSPKKAEDPAAVGSRIETQTTKMPTYLMVAARKTRETIEEGDIYQSDYVTQWNNAE